MEPIKLWRKQKGILAVLFFILLYKVGDDLATALSSTFFLRELHFTLATLGVVSKTVGFAAAIVGVLLGGVLVARMGVMRSLFWFGCLQALASLCYLACALFGNHLWLFVLTSSCENFTAGMGTAAFLAFIMSLCDVRYAATQFALLSAIASVGRVCIGPIASGLVATVGWVGLFIAAFFAAFPALVLLFFINEK
jgi:PAT family beta-lactamase induction signal transducer AmpG